MGLVEYATAAATVTINAAQTAVRLDLTIVAQRIVEIFAKAYDYATIS
jgi:hypothetical protein